MYNKPLAYNHGYYPSDLISTEQMALLERHYFAAVKLNSDNFERVMSKEFNQDERILCAELYATLKEKGFIPDGMLVDNKIKWKIQMKDDVEVLKEKMPPLPDLSEDGPYSETVRKKIIADMQQECRTRFSGLMEGI